jgi:hypothetical protein
MESDDAGLETIFFPVVEAETFGDQLLPAVGVLRLGWVGIFLERCDLRL